MERTCVVVTISEEVNQVIICKDEETAIKLFIEKCSFYIFGWNDYPLTREECKDSGITVEDVVREGHRAWCHRRVSLVAPEILES